MMSSFQKQQEQVILEINESRNQIETLKKELIQIEEDKLFYKRKEDSPAFDKTLKKEIDAKNKIAFLSNNINVLNKKLSKLKSDEKQSIKTRNEMEKVLKQIYLGNNRVQASKNSGISLSKISKWYDEGKQNLNPDSVYFYNKAVTYENYHYYLFDLFKKEFKQKGKIHLLRSFVPKSYPQRMDKFYNDDSLLWLSRLELRNDGSIYYFGLKGDNIPQLVLKFNKNYKISNFRLYGDEVLILLKFSNINEIKQEFKLLKVKDTQKNLYYVSLGKLNSGILTDKIELLIARYIDCFSNPMKIF